MGYSLRRVVIFGITLILLAGCGMRETSLQPNIQPAEYGPTATALARLGNQLIARRPSEFELNEAAKSSWMAPNAKQQDLLYVSDAANNWVDVYTYPKGKLVGTLGGFSSPEGACTDARGNVWITSQRQNEILEFAHGGTTPIATLTQEDQLFDGCSVDTTTGTLAVDSFCQLSVAECVQPGSVFIYTNIKKPPKRYGDSNINLIYFCGYDSNGNLFVDGNQDGFDPPAELAELPKGSSTFTNISLNRIIYFPGGVQWDGKYIAVGDQEAGGELTSSVHQIAVTGSTGTVVSTTKLEGTEDVVQFWIQGSRIVAPDIERTGANDVRLFKYPAGGVPVGVITGGLLEPYGATVSLAQKGVPSRNKGATP
jgi:hypothetical protein